MQAGDSGPKSCWGAPQGAHPTSGSTMPGGLPAGHTFPCLHCSAAFFLVRWSTVDMSQHPQLWRHQVTATPQPCVPSGQGTCQQPSRGKAAGTGILPAWLGPDPVGLPLG